MKLPLLALLISLVTINIFAQPNNTPASNENSPANHANETSTLKSNHEPDAHTGTSHQSSPPWYTSPEWWIVIIAGFTGIFIALQAREMRKATEVMSRSSERQLRAYVVPDNAGVIDGSLCIPPQPYRIGIPGVGMLIKNCGQTPAYKVVSWAQIAVISVRDENLMLVVPDDIRQYPHTLGSGQTFTKTLWYDRPLAANEITDIANGVRAIYLYGRVEYEDVFGEPRFVKFRLHYTGAFPPPQNVATIFNFSEGGNDAN